MTLTEFIKVLQSHQKQIGCDGERVGSHKLKSHVDFMITNPELDFSLEIDDSEYPHGIEQDLLFGCMCPYGITIRLKAVYD